MSAATIALVFLLVGPLARPTCAQERGVILRVEDDTKTEREKIKTPAEEIAEIQKKIDHKELPNIEFEFDSYQLKLESYETLDLIAGVMLRNPRRKMNIIAHTDSVGTNKYNLKLSIRRAAAVKDYLAKRGVPPPSMHAYGKGAKEPIADNNTDEGRQRNRRVEFNILKRGWSSVY